MKTYVALTDFWHKHNVVQKGEKVVMSDAEVKYLKHAVKEVPETTGTGPTAPVAEVKAAEEPKEETSAVARRHKKADDDGVA